MEEALGRENSRLDTLKLTGRVQDRGTETTLTDDEWLALLRKIDQVSRSLTRVRRREQGVRLVLLLIREGSPIPAWLERTATSVLESTTTVLGNHRQREEESFRIFTSTPARPPPPRETDLETPETDPQTHDPDVSSFLREMRYLRDIDIASLRGEEEENIKGRPRRRNIRRRK